MGCSAMLIMGIIFLAQNGERKSLGLILLLVGIFAPCAVVTLYAIVTACIAAKLDESDDEFDKKKEVPTRVVTSLNVAPPPSTSPSTPPAVPLTEQQEQELSSL